MYSHDTMGLGHVRRNLLIAQELALSHLNPVILLITGIGEASALALPPRSDLLTLPALYKEPDGHYRPRHLDLSLQEVIALRAQTIRAALEAFEPDVLIVDKVPRGAVGELDPTLRYLRRNPRCRSVLGLRDVLDDPATVEREWSLSGAHDTIRDFYDAVWVYGDPAVYDPVREYQLPVDIAAMVRYTGYLGQCTRPQIARLRRREVAGLLGSPRRRFVLCLVGGGQDGASLAEAFAEASLPAGIGGVIVTGPFMPLQAQRRLRRRAAGNPHLRVLGFIPQAVPLVEYADHIIAMGGYNTVCEILSFQKPALVVPRVSPRLEQWIRAERLHNLGLFDILHPDKLSAESLSEWLHRDVVSPGQVHERVDMRGLKLLPGLAEELMSAPSRRFQGQSHQSEARHVGH